MYYRGVSYPGWDDPGQDEVQRKWKKQLRDMWRGGWVSPETPAPFGVLLA